MAVRLFLLLVDDLREPRYRFSTAYVRTTLSQKKTLQRVGRVDSPMLMLVERLALAYFMFLYSLFPLEISSFAANSAMLPSSIDKEYFVSRGGLPAEPGMFSGIKYLSRRSPACSLPYGIFFYNRSFGLLSSVYFPLSLARCYILVLAF